MPLYASHHQEAKIVLYSNWYHHTCRWLFGRPPTGVMIPEYQNNEVTQEVMLIMQHLSCRVPTAPHCCISLFVHGTTLFFVNMSSCNTKQSIYYSASSLYMFRVSTTTITSSTQNCNYSLRYCAVTSLHRGLATLEGGSCTVREAVVTVLCTPDDGCG